MKNVIENAFIEILSGIARYHKDGGVITENECGNSVTISFPTNSPSYAVEKVYYGNGQKFWETEYKNGLKHDKYTEWHKNGQKRWEIEFQNGLRHGKSIWWNENGKKYCEREYQNGKLINEINY